MGRSIATLKINYCNIQNWYLQYYTHTHCHRLKIPAAIRLYFTQHPITPFGWWGGGCSQQQPAAATSAQQPSSRTSPS